MLVATQSAHGRSVAAPTGPTPVAADTPTWIAAPAHTRAQRVRFSVSGGQGLCIGELRVLGPSRTAPPVLGGDLSFAQQESAAGAGYTDRGVAAAPEQILSYHGFNYARLRVWVDPPRGYSDLESMLATARRAHAAGLQLLIDFHYSGFWADPDHQATPDAWAGQGLPELRRTVRDYTSRVLDALRAQGTPAGLIQVGNETRAGMLWPTGKIDFDDAAHGWDAFGSLLRAGVAGAKRAAGPTPRIAIHLDDGADNDLGRYYFDNIVDQNVDFDLIGLSYYPFFHGAPSDLRTNLDDLSARYDKDVILLETQYPWTLGYADDQANICCDPDKLTPGYPATAGGQLALQSDTLSILAAVPGGHGAGLLYWAPDWLAGVGYSPEAGNPNENLTLFDFSGATLPAIELRNPIAACSLYDAGESPCTFDSPAD